MNCNETAAKWLQFVPSNTFLRFWDETRGKLSHRISILVQKRNTKALEQLKGLLLIQHLLIQSINNIIKTHVRLLRQLTQFIKRLSGTIFPEPPSNSRLWLSFFDFVFSVNLLLVYFTRGSFFIFAHFFFIQFDRSRR